MRIQECPTTKVCNRCDVEKKIEEFVIRKEHVQKYCISCEQARKNRLYTENKKEYKARAKEWASNNRERRREISTAYDSRNRDKAKQYHASRKIEVNLARVEKYKQNPEKHRKLALDWYYANKHRDDVKADRNERKMARGRDTDIATPSWSNRAFILATYEYSRFLTRTTGVKHNVDHIFPIKSDWVCGLHVPENLNVITAFENQSKGNRPVEDIVPSV